LQKNGDGDSSKRVEQIIARSLNSPKDFFVFPSEVAGEYQLRTALLTGGRRVVRSDRFISWDRLKEREFSPSREKMPSNSLYRTLFSMNLLEEHVKKGPLLRVLLGKGRPDPPADSPASSPEAFFEEPPEEDVSMFRSQLAAMLPQLQKVIRLLDERKGRGGEAFPEALEGDLRFLLDSYLDFLEKNGLFEPAYISPTAGVSEYRYHIFFPELIEDYREYRGLLEGSESFIVHPVGEIYAAGASPKEASSLESSSRKDSSWGAGLRPILRFENARKELQYMISRIHSLLESGADPGDIAVTLPDYEAWQPFLQEEARIRDIPLDFRAGKKLSEYPAGLLFQRIGELRHSGMALDQLKQLVLEPVYPWREREALEALLRFGVEHYFVRNLPGRGPESDTLASKLKSAGETVLLNLYTRLQNQLRRMMSADSAETLQQEVHIFLRTFFDPEAWHPEAEKVLQYCLLVLREMREAEDRLESLRISSPYTLWISLMKQRVYVSGARKGMLPVYRYRVSAGINPVWHFIPGAGQAETRVKRENFPFLRDDFKALLPGEGSFDFSQDFLTVYAGSGKQVFMSCSDRGFGGPQLPPAELIGTGPADSPEGRTRPGTVSTAGGDGDGGLFKDPYVVEDPYVEEERFWALGGEFPQRLFGLQIRGFDAMVRSGFAPKKTDYTETAISDEFLKDRLSRVIRGERGARDGRVWLSPTSFDCYTGCAYLFYLQSGLGLGREEFSSPYADHRLMGSMLHNILARLYRRVQDEDGRWQSEHGEAYLEIADEEIGKEFEIAERKGLAFLEPAWEWFRAAALVQIGAFIREEGRLFDGYELAGTEKEMELPLPGGRAGMYGRIDRLSVRDGKFALVDYKKGKMPSRAEVYQEEELPVTSQLPFYAYVADRKGCPVASAAYYSLKEERFSHIFVHPEAPVAGNLGRARAVLQPEEFADQAERIAGSIELVADDMERGIFLVRENCDSCDMRSVCRTRYNLRLPEEKRGS
jgi:RecB family exonuclease